MSKSLGMRRKALKCCLHDPFAENALVLYAPPDVSAHAQLNQSEYVKCVPCFVEAKFFISTKNIHIDIELLASKILSLS